MLSKKLISALHIHNHKEYSIIMFHHHAKLMLLPILQTWVEVMVVILLKELLKDSLLGQIENLLAFPKMADQSILHFIRVGKHMTHVMSMFATVWWSTDTTPTFLQCSIHISWDVMDQVQTVTMHNNVLKIQESVVTLPLSTWVNQWKALVDFLQTFLVQKILENSSKQCSCSLITCSEERYSKLKEWYIHYQKKNL